MPERTMLHPILAGSEEKLIALSEADWSLLYAHPIVELYLQESLKLHEFTCAACYDEVKISPWHMELQQELVAALERQVLRYVDGLQTQARIDISWMSA